MKDYYAILGVERAASGRAIKSAYRRLALTYHPDVARDERAARKFLVIQEAYEVLSDPDSRRRYDASLPRPEPASRGRGRSWDLRISLGRLDLLRLGLRLGGGPTRRGRTRPRGPRRPRP